MSDNTKLFKSRIIRLALIAVFILTGIKLISFALAAWLILIIRDLKPDEAFKIDSLVRITEILSVAISGAVGTIITAVVARYGFREATRNIGGGGEN